jgi:sec-independent protein translocase protein TatB
MFDFAFSEIALVGVVALLVIGPKDMPVAVKAITDVIKKARRMAGEFQGHVDEMMREANLHEVRDGINDLRSMNVKNRIISAVDGDGTMRRALNEDPFKTPAATVAPTIMQPGSAEPAGTEPAVAALSADAAPSFVPPGDAASVAPPGFTMPAPPAFIPPDAAAPRT